MAGQIDAEFVGGPLDGRRCLVDDLDRVGLAVPREDIAFEPNAHPAERPFKIRKAFYERTERKGAEGQTIYRYVD